MLVPLLFVRLQYLEGPLIVDFYVLREIVAHALYDALVLLHRTATALARSAAKNRVHSLGEHEVPRVLEHHVAADRVAGGLHAEHGRQPVLG